MAAISNFPREPQDEKSQRQKRKLSERQANEHCECRQIHLHAPACCRCVTAEQKFRSPLWPKSKKRRLLQKAHRFDGPNLFEARVENRDSPGSADCLSAKPRNLPAPSPVGLSRNKAASSWSANATQFAFKPLGA
jgi:hypothetical protein